MQLAYRAKVGQKWCAQLPVKKKGLCIEASDAPLINSHETPCFQSCLATVVVIDQRPRIISSMPSCCGDSCRDIEFFSSKLAFRATKTRIEPVDFCEGSTSEGRICSLNNTWRDEAVRSKWYARD